MTTAGRDTGNYVFEHEALTRHIEVYQSMLLKFIDAQDIKIVLRALDPEPGENPLFEQVCAQLGARFSETRIEIIRKPQHEQGYYRGLQFGLHWTRGGQTIPIADGGFTDWTRQLSGNHKERFLGSGIGLELLFKLLHGMV